jgi:O-methyltransferase involved in polyketide biosynthesis
MPSTLSRNALLLTAAAVAIAAFANPALCFTSAPALPRKAGSFLGRIHRRDGGATTTVVREAGGPPPGTPGGPGGPPIGSSGGGPPPGTPGGPGGPPIGSSGGGPPVGGPPGGGTGAPGGLEKVFETAWPLLYAFDSEGKQDGVRDSSKNLRVLWTRALLSKLGRIEDEVAFELLPTGTRQLVGNFLASTLWSSPVGAPAVDKLGWIVNRTNFIDGQLQAFLDETEEGGQEGGGSKRQVVVLGAGYDTRSLRFQRPGLQFFEVDLPDIASAKAGMLGRFLERREAVVRPKHVGFDLNDIATKKSSLVEELVKGSGVISGGGGGGGGGGGDSNAVRLDLDPAVPTMVICEAVLFYLQPDAVQGLVKELFALPNARRFCFTDNLAKLGVAPGPPVPTPREKCEGWLGREGKTLIEHDAIWGGAIHFVAAK